MFPFSLNGPDFLVFFAAFTAVLLAIYGLFAFVVGFSVRAPRLNHLAANPYQIAYLRGGFRELGRVAVVNLADRGMLIVHGSQMRRAGASSSEYVRQPIDKAILECCPGLTDPGRVLGNSRVTRIEAEYSEGLKQSGLLLGDRNLRARSVGFAIVVVLVGGLAMARGAQAFLAGGQMKISLLLVLTGVAAVIAWKISRKRISAAGHKALASLRALLAEKNAVWLRRGGGSTNVAVFAALHGIYVLPHEKFDFVRALFPSPRQQFNESDFAEWIDTLEWDGGGGCGGGCGGCGG